MECMHLVADDIIIALVTQLNLDITKSQFSAYTVAGNKFLIAHFYNLKHKQMIINKMRIRRSLMDHLTPYFNRLYLLARQANKESKLFTASSYGGRIRVRKHRNDMPTQITSEAQLQIIIDMDGLSSVEISSDSIKLVEETSNASTSTKKNSNHVATCND